RRFSEVPCVFICRLLARQYGVVLEPSEKSATCNRSHGILHNKNHERSGMSRWLGNMKKNRLFIGVATAMACLPVNAQNAAQNEIEEVVVTGSYIRGSA